MISIDQAWHLVNFTAPALAMALLLPLSARYLLRLSAPAVSLWWQIVIQFIAGSGTIATALWLLGRDGKMAMYGALVLLMASLQWVLSRAWRR